MVADRLEVRVDPERRRKIAKVAELQDESISELMRQMIDRIYDEAMLEYRKELVRRISAAEVEDVPDPEELSRQLDETYAIGDLH